ncbi:MAG: cytochrome c3 family protein [Proteobacteria bacterium]|nr:cytochrome c3 family protein [Pseudomonadota bacterium]
MKKRIAALALVVVSTGVYLVLESVRQRSVLLSPVLPMNFAHQDHTEQACFGCHHNFIDDSGHGLCIDCHKTNTEVAGQIETQFHDLCRTCHIENQIQGEDTGPVRACIDCHEGDDLP